MAQKHRDRQTGGKYVPSEEELISVNRYKYSYSTQRMPWRCQFEIFRHHAIHEMTSSSNSQLCSFDIYASRFSDSTYGGDAFERADEEIDGPMSQSLFGFSDEDEPPDAREDFFLFHYGEAPAPITHLDPSPLSFPRPPGHRRSVRRFTGAMRAQPPP